MDEEENVEHLRHEIEAITNEIRTDIEAMEQTFRLIESFVYWFMNIDENTYEVKYKTAGGNDNV